MHSETVRDKVRMEQDRVNVMCFIFGGHTSGNTFVLLIELCVTV